MSQASISLIMVTMNAAETFRESLESIRKLNQPLQLIVQDGGSTDETPQIAEDFEDLITHWDSGSDRGIYDAMTKALTHADREFVYFLGADDRLLPGWGDAIPELRDTRSVYYGDVCMASNQQRYAGAFDARKLAGINLCQQAIFYPRSVFTRHPFNPHYPLQADWALNMALWKDPDINFHYLEKTLCLYNDVSGKSSTTRDRAFEADYPTLLLQHFGLPSFLRHGLPSMAATFVHRLAGTTRP